ncbi:cytochrome B561 [Gluconacetobacter johannae DSM 13595]|uniref:Cytochrome b n=1 Tax=Gluconacetobacter johannae TaxID=112140 RepID=A0A7W4P4T7_9PROT|nr:cytochrome b/b6 domain-containing protein [Gluconacetobacter johannae]MBB2177224.1 cytochrome b [Gluconacetobacter johannae]GBQ81828.1 cytochrome B561 [Gluconacetobacter johannae DSM 13595]
MMTDPDDFGLRAGDTCHDSVTRLLHWATAGIVLVQFSMGITWAYYDAPAKAAARNIHTTIGVIFTALLLFRLFWRWRWRMRGAPQGTRARATLAGGMHAVLYGLLLMEAALGFEWRWSGNRPLYVLGAYLSCAVCRLDKAGHHIVATLHSYGAWTIMVLAFGHAVVALWRHYVRRDGTLRRMAPFVS